MESTRREALQLAMDRLESCIEGAAVATGSALYPKSDI